MISRTKTLWWRATIPMAVSTTPSALVARANRFPRPGDGTLSVVIQPDGKIVVAGGAFPLFTFSGQFRSGPLQPERIAGDSLWERRNRDDEFSRG